jgi:hypothetical protein
MTTTLPTIDSWPEAGDFLEPVIRALPAYLMQQRWYTAKGAGPARVSLNALVPIQAPGLIAVLAIWRASVHASQHIDLLLPLARVSAAEWSGTATAKIAALSNGDRSI